MINNEWKKSSYSIGNGACVEVAVPGEVLVRDSKLVNSPVLAFTKAEWSAFLEVIKK